MGQSVPLLRKSHARRQQIEMIPALGGTGANGRSVFSDPAFAGNKSLPIHRWVPWIAGFSSDFVKEVFERHLLPGGTVLDPFCGVGTTLVEAGFQNHKSIGFEINPYAAFASRVKAKAHQISLNILEKEIGRFDAFYTKRVDSSYKLKSTPPLGFRTRAPFYSSKVLRKVLIFLDFSETIENVDVRDLFRLAFGSTMIQYSNYSYEPSLGRRVSAGKTEVEDYPVMETIIAKLRSMKNDIEWIQTQPRKRGNGCKVFQASFFDSSKYLENNSVDLVVTSPPYLNNYHYNRNTRPQLYWLGFAEQPQDLVPIEMSNFGKFWQTVRDKEDLNLEFELAGSDLPQQISLLRTLKQEKGVYGGNGWANYAASYFNDCRKFANGIKYALKPGGKAFVVIGNSILQGIMMPTDRYFAQIAESVGLEVIGIEIPRETRVGNSIIRSGVRVSKAERADQLYEAIVQLQKT